MGMRALLAEAREMTIVADSNDGAGVLAAAETSGLDVVVCDFDLPDRSAILLANALREVAPTARVLVLAATATDSNVKQALLAGIVGYVLKGQPPAEILAAIRDVGAGRRVLPARTHEVTLAASVLRAGSRASALDRLSAREREIFDLIIWGQTNKQVAVKLGISVKTVETHRSHINGKLQVHSAAELVRLASLCGVLTSPGHDVSSVTSSAAADAATLPALATKSGGGGEVQVRAHALVAKSG